MSLTNDLCCRVALYTRHQVQTDLGDQDFVDRLYSMVWAKITPTGGSVSGQPGDMQQAQLAHTITIRANALPQVDEDMFILYRGHRYNVDTWRPHYRDRSKIELMCTMEVQPYDGRTQP